MESLDLEHVVVVVVMSSESAREPMMKRLLLRERLPPNCHECTN